MIGVDTNILVRYLTRDDEQHKIVIIPQKNDGYYQIQQEIKRGLVMSVNYILSEYIDSAMSQAIYDKLEDATFVGRIPSCKGVIAFASTLRQCENELRSTLEDWILLGLKFGHTLPIINNIDLNKEPVRESVDTL